MHFKKSHRLFDEITRAMPTSRLAYKNAWSLVPNDTFSYVHFLPLPSSSHILHFHLPHGHAPLHPSIHTTCLLPTFSSQIFKPSSTLATLAFQCLLPYLLYLDHCLHLFTPTTPHHSSYSTPHYPSSPPATPLLLHPYEMLTLWLVSPGTGTACQAV